jgi:hypothetical protein
MFEIEPLNGFWTIKHLICGATFQITGKIILNAKQPIQCPNCGIPIDTEVLKSGVDKFVTSIKDIKRSTLMPGDHNRFAWEINPPIKIIEKPLSNTGTESGTEQ